MLPCKLKRHLGGNTLLLNRHVALVPCQRHHEPALLVCCILDHLVNPVLHSVERSFIRQIVADDGSNCVSVVKVNHRPELFRTASIPDVQLDLLLRSGWVVLVRNVDCFLDVRPADRDVVQIVELVLAEAKSNR